MSEASTNLDTHNSDGTLKKGAVINPTGKGGFQERPQDRSDGRWSKDNSFSYWMNFFKHLTVQDFKAYERTKPEDERTVAESIAYARVAKSRNNLVEFKEVADRTEGKASQSIDMTTNGKEIQPLLVKFIEAAPDDN